MRMVDEFGSRMWRRFHRHELRLEMLGVCHLDLAPDPPAPDPLIGQAAAANAEVGKEALGLAREQWAWNKEKADEIWPTAKRVIDSQVASMDESTRRSRSEWDAYEQLYLPAERRYVEQQMSWDSPERREREAQTASAEVGQGYDIARGTMERGLQRAGVRPGGAGFTQAASDLARAEAADRAGAANNARRRVEAEGMAGLERLTNIGRGRPSTSFAADQLALSAGNSGVANQNQTLASTNAGLNSAQGWYNTSLAGFRGQGDILNQQYNNQLRGWQAESDASAGMWGGIGKLAGTAMGAGGWSGLFSFKDGGMIPSRAERGLMRRAQRKVSAYADGGMIEGPGTSTSDSVPAVIDGQEPARLSSGEAVLNADAVQIVGEEFVERINQAGLQRRGQRPPQTIDGLSRRV